MSWSQQLIILKPKSRGIHLISSEVVSQLTALADFQVGLAHFFLMHTSASLTINENADADVGGDLARHLAVLVPENAAHFRHTLEGPDDMPAHIKTALLGVSVTIPIRAGSLCLGTWQGLCLCEHRNQGGPRHLMVTLQGHLISSSSE